MRVRAHGEGIEGRPMTTAVEFFSGVFRGFTFSVAKTHAAVDADSWTVVGTCVAKNVRDLQVSLV